MNRLYRCFFAFGLTLSVMCGEPTLSLAAGADKAKSGTDAPPPIDRIPILKLFSSQGVSITYLGRQYSLDGWLLVKDDSIQVVYTTVDGQGSVVGSLYGPGGDLVTSKQLLAAKEKGALPASVSGTPKTMSIIPSDTASAAGTAAPATAASARTGELPSERLWKQVEASTYIKFGSDTAPPFYVIMDPRCHFCHDLYTAIASKYLASNAMQLRVIPVGILGPDSAKEAQQVVSAPDTAPKLWDEIEHNNVADLGKIDGDAAGKTSKNHDIMSQWHLTGTPACIYRSKDGKVKVVLGAPHDLDAVVADLGVEKPH